MQSPFVPPPHVLNRQRNRTTLTILYTVEKETKVDDASNTSRASTSLGGPFGLSRTAETDSIQSQNALSKRATATSFCTPDPTGTRDYTDTKVDDMPNTSRASTSLGESSGLERTGTLANSSEGFSSVNRDDGNTLEVHVVLSDKLTSDTPSN
jgi:hypothetical protein